MADQRAVDRLLSTLSVTMRPEVYVYAVTAQRPSGDDYAAVIQELEGWTVVCTREFARQRSWSYTYDCRWISVEAQSSLEMVGLTKALSSLLADAGIACNVLAGYFHDHLLVPEDKADQAISVLSSAALAR